MLYTKLKQQQYKTSMNCYNYFVLILLRSAYSEVALLSQQPISDRSTPTTHSLSSLMTRTKSSLPPKSVYTRAAEIDNIVAWAAENNLKTEQIKVLESSLP